MIVGLAERRISTSRKIQTIMYRGVSLWCEARFLSVQRKEMCGENLKTGCNNVSALFVPFKAPFREKKLTNPVSVTLRTREA